MGELTPKETIARECARRGRAAVVAGCIQLVRGDYRDTAFALALGGQSAEPILAGTKRVDDSYWLRVWGARGLLWEWDESAMEAVRGGLVDEAWRVREMAAKVIARHVVGDLLDAVAPLRDDPVPRVRAAATRAVAAISAARA